MYVELSHTHSFATLHLKYIFTPLIEPKYRAERLMMQLSKVNTSHISPISLRLHKPETF